MAYKYERVMIIDDSGIERMISEKILRLHGVVEQAVKFDSAGDALNYLRSLEATPQQCPELILLDLNMPVMNGFEFLEAYGKLPESVKTKNIIVLTSSVWETDRERAMASPYVRRFLTRPLTEAVAKSL